MVMPRSAKVGPVTIAASRFDLITNCKEPFSYYVGITKKHPSLTMLINVRRTHTFNQFNQPLGNCNTAAVTTMSDMFAGARAFNQPLGT
jgi:hypothetical protein